MLQDKPGGEIQGEAAGEDALIGALIKGRRSERVGNEQHRRHGQSGEQGGVDQGHRDLVDDVREFLCGHESLLNVAVQYECGPLHTQRPEPVSRPHRQTRDLPFFDQEDYR